MSETAQIKKCTIYCNMQKKSMQEKKNINFLSVNEEAPKARKLINVNTNNTNVSSI